MERIILIGDSLTQRGYCSGWVSALSDTFIRTAVVANAGLSGYNTRWILDHLRNPASPYVASYLSTSSSPPLFVTVWLGANDAAFKGVYQHVPLAEYESNLREIILWIRNTLRPLRGIILLTPPPCDGAAWAEQSAKTYGTPVEAVNRSVSVARKYREAVIRVGRELSVESVIDTFAVLGVDENSDALGEWADNFVDGLHFNAKGDAKISQAIQAAVKSDLQIDVGQLPFSVPAHTIFKV